MQTDLDIEQDYDAAILHYIANAILNLDDAELLHLPNQIGKSKNTSKNARARVSSDWPEADKSTTLHPPAEDKLTAA